MSPYNVIRPEYQNQIEDYQSCRTAWGRDMDGVCYRFIWKACRKRKERDDAMPEEEEREK